MKVDDKSGDKAKGGVVNGRIITYTQGIVIETC